MAAEPTPLTPTATAHLFPDLGRSLVDLLRGLSADDWERPTVCSAWAVRDVTAHLLDTAYRRLGVERDGYSPPTDVEIEGYDDLVRWLDRLNAEWVAASRRLSPRLLTDLLATIEPQLAEALAALDPEGPARFPVSWAGEASSAGWFDIARELTERWLHQQQIRLAVGAPPLSEPELSRAIFDTFLRALPHRYGDTPAAPGSDVRIEVVGDERYLYTLRRGGDSWSLLSGAVDDPATAVRIAEADAWLALTKGIAPGEAEARARIEGDRELARPLFDTVAVMA